MNFRPGLCQCGCGEPLGTAFHLDHIHPLARGGSHTMDNLQITHPICNIRKGAMVLGL
jgi:5-methylcytosine-specific restriction endonuclease McrA